MVPVATEKSKQALQKEAFVRYGAEFGEIVLKGRKVGGQYLSRRRPQHLFGYPEVESGALQAIMLAADVYARCLKILDDFFSEILKGSRFIDGRHHTK